MRRSEALGGGRRDAGASLDRARALSSPPLIEADADPEGGPRLETSDVRPKTLARAAAYLATQNRALAASAARRRAAILANMEMWRWEPRDMGERRIEVNVPDFSVAILDGDTVLQSARVIVGKPATPTPIFSNVMRYVLINPSGRCRIRSSGKRCCRISHRIPNISAGAAMK